MENKIKGASPANWQGILVSMLSWSANGRPSPMIPDYTPAVLRALDFSRQWAHSFGSETILPLHLLLALLEEDEGRVASLLRGAGLDLELARQELGAGAFAAAGALPPDAACPEFNFETNIILRDACRFAGALAVDEGLTTEQVLLALLHGSESLRGQLEALGLSWEHMQKSSPAEPTHVEEPLAVDGELLSGDVAERMDAARILDAAQNRAREALRVIEDYCRFALDDAFLTGELKRLRHDLVEALALHNADRDWDLAARETLRDVGTSLSVPQEQERGSLLSVAQINHKRLQEALRSLEEFGKLKGPALGRAIEGLRYRAYTLERALVLGTTARRRLADARLYLLVTGALCEGSMEWTIAEAAAGGVDVVQLREKTLTDRDLLERARAVRRWTRQTGVLFVMNDRPDIARLAEADGVHLGQDELPVKEARRILGPDALIGVSTHTIEQVRQAVLDGGSYIGVGPTFASQTKEFGELAGIDFVRQAATETTLPAFAIGGVNAVNAHEVVAAGLRRIAVSHAICKADDPRRAARELREILANGEPGASATGV